MARARQWATLPFSFTKEELAVVLQRPERRYFADFGHDLHYAARIIRRNPGYAAAAMLCLALGIGVNATVFSLLDGMYFRMLPVPHPDRVVAIDRDGGMPLFWRDYLAVRGDLHTFSGVAAVAGERHVHGRRAGEFRHRCGDRFRKLCRCSPDQARSRPMVLASR